MFKSFSVVFAAALLSLSLATAKADTIAQARAAGLYGLTPDLSRNVGFGRANQGQQVAWNDFGIYFSEQDGKAFVSGLKPDGAAAQQGAKIGDVVRFANLVTVYGNFFTTTEMDPENRFIELYVIDGESGWQNSYRLTPVAASGEVATIPQALRGAATSRPGIMAIINATPDAANPADVTRDAMLALQAISAHARGCAGPNAVEIPITINQTTTTRNGLGQIRGTENASWIDVLRVRPEFAPWARANIRNYPVAPVSTVRTAVLNLIRDEGCTGAGFLQLEAGLAAVMGVALPQQRGPSPTGPAGFPADNTAFLGQCVPLMNQQQQQQNGTFLVRGSVTACFCFEHAARALNDPKLYETLQILDYAYLTENEQLHTPYNEVFLPCYQAMPGTELRQKIEALWREMGI